MAAFSDSRIVLAGHHGYVQMTTDRGSHWTPQLLDPPTFGRDTSFSDIQVIDSNTSIAVGHWGGLFKSTDRGENWINLSCTQSIDYYGNGLEFVDANNGWMVGWDYTQGVYMNTWRTRDGGLSWEPAPQINVPGLDIEFLGQKGWLLTPGRPLWRTQNGGETWAMSNLATNAGSSPSPSQMAWGNASFGYVCGWDGYIAKSVNGGASWTQLGQMQEGMTYLGVLAIGSNEVWVCGAREGGGQAVVKRSVDGGATWRTWNLPGQYTTPYQMIKTPSYLYVSGYSGAVWRMPLGTRTQRLP
ncbi:MAG: WD40/YVTN/BNR-like repeat-containing protein [Fimbriimonadales bacterium]